MPEKHNLPKPSPGASATIGAEWMRIRCGVGASALGQVVAVFQTVCIVPFFISAWGVEGYGRWVTLTSCVAYLGLIEFGGQQYIANLVADSHAKRDDAGIGIMLSEATSFFLLLGSSALFLLVLVLGVLRLAPLPHIGAFLLPSDIWVLTCMAAVVLVFGIPVGIYLTIYRATGLFARAMMLGNLLRLFGAFVSIGALYKGISLKAYAVLMLSVSALQASVIVWDSRRLIPVCRSIRIDGPAALAGRRYLKGSIYSWLVAVAQSLMQQGVIFILSVVASSSVVAVYATHRTLANVSGYASLLLLGPIIPEIAFYWANDRFAEVQNVTILSIKYVVLATGVLAAVLWLVTPSIYPMWTGKQLNINSWLLFILLVQGVLAAGWATSTWGLLATNQFRPMAKWYLANAVVTMVLAMLWAKPYGLVGVASASLIGDITCGLVVFPVLAAAQLKIPALKIYSALFSAMLALTPMLAVAAWASWAQHGWISFASFLVLTPLWGYAMMCMALGREETAVAFRKARNSLILRFGLEPLNGH